MELGNNSYEDKFIKSAIFKDKINDLTSGIDILLDEFKKLYVIVNMHPNNQEYQQQYQNIVNNLGSVMSKMFSVSNDIQINVNNINKKLLEYDVLIREEKKINKDLKINLGIVENKNNASYEMITDYKDIYEKRYLRNWSLILGSILGLIAISRVYKKPLV
jgi:hypothetical protein